MSPRLYMMNHSGFTAIETVIAVLIFSTMALVIAKTLTSVTFAVEQSSHRRKAATLAAMVLEQYDAYAATSYDALASYDTTRVLPRQFFHTPDNLGYDGFAISSQADCAEDGSTCQVTVGILSGHGSQARTVNFTRKYDEDQLSTNSTFGSGI